MGKPVCPFCNSQDTFNIAYGYLGEKKDKENYIDQEDIGLNVNYRKREIEKIDFDGERVSSRRPNRYCKNCGKVYHSRKVLYTVDMNCIDFIINVKNDYYRYTFDLTDKKNIKYTLKKNWLPIISDAILSESESYKILATFKTNKPNMWHGHYGDSYDIEKFGWVLKCTYFNGVDYCKSGNDALPDNWNEFITPFKEVLDKSIFDLCN